MFPAVSMIIFAIHAAIKLGQKIRSIFEDEIRDRDLLLPPVGFTPPDLPYWEPKVKNFFENEGRAFVAPPPQPSPGDVTRPQPPEGLYFKLWQQRDIPEIQAHLCLAYQRVHETVSRHRQEDDVTGDYRREPEKFYCGANALFTVKQWREGTDPKRPVWQRLAGTVVELAVDYVKVAPGLFSGNGRGDQIVRAFLLSLDNVEFAESRHDELLLDILRASLNTFAAQAELAVSDETLALLLKRVSTTLVEQIEQAEESDDAYKLLALYNFRRDMLQDILKVSAATVSDQANRLLGFEDSQEKQLLNIILQAVLHTVQAQPDLFSSQTLRDIYGAALTAVAQNPTLIFPGQGDDQGGEFLRRLFTEMAGLLFTAGQEGPQALFTPDLAKEVITLALDNLSQNVRQLIDPEDPGTQLLVDALQRVILSFSVKFHHDPELPKILAATFSQKQLLAMIQEAFGAVSENPEALLPGPDDDPGRSALAQIVGTIALAVGQDTQRLLTGDKYVKLLRVALQACAVNPDRLLDLGTAELMDNVMTKVVSACLSAASENHRNGGRLVLWGEVLLQTIEACLSEVSKNTLGFLADSEVVTLALRRLLKAASGEQANVLDAENLLLVLRPLLRRTLKEGRSILEENDEPLILQYLAQTL